MPHDDKKKKVKTRNPSDYPARPARSTSSMRARSARNPSDYPAKPARTTSQVRKDFKSINEIQKQKKKVNKRG